MIRSIHRRALALALSAAAVAAGGCARPRIRQDIVWPPPPEVARIRLVNVMRTSEDLSPSLFRRIARALLPHNPASVVSPTGLALSPDEKRLYVACGAQGFLAVIDFEAQAVSRFRFGGKDVPSTTPGVALDADENVYVSDRALNSVFVFDRKGGFLRKFGSDRLVGPNSLAFDRKAQVLYVISGGTSRDARHTIEAYSPRGEHIRTLGGERSDEKGFFNFPQHLTVAPNGELWVSDMLNFRVQVFNPEGTFKTSFGMAGTGGAGAFDKIKGIAFDTFHNVYVVDAQQGVHVFNPNLQRLILFGNQPISSVPGAIVIDSTNRIFVTDFSSNAVFEYQVVNTTAEDSFAPREAASPAAPPAATPPVTPSPEK